MQQQQTDTQHLSPIASRTAVDVHADAATTTKRAYSAATAKATSQHQTSTRVPDVLSRIALWKDVSATAQSTLTALAIVAGTIWFFWRRERVPRANVRHELRYWYVGGRLILHVVVAVENVGDVMLRLKGMSMRVQQVLPTPKDIEATIMRGEDPVQPNETEILWPDIGNRECNWKRRDRREIEPDETDEFHFSFALPAETKAVEVYTHIRNRKKRFIRIGWNTNSFWALKASGIFTADEGTSDKAEHHAKETLITMATNDRQTSKTEEFQKQGPAKTSTTTTEEKRQGPEKTATSGTGSGPNSGNKK